MIDYIPLIFTVFVGVILAIVFVFLSEFFGAKRRTKTKYTTYESGMLPFSPANQRFSIKFYMIAVSFIIFDIEVVFLYPWAIQFRQLATPGIVAMGIFLLILFLGYLYELKKGGFEWE